MPTTEEKRAPKHFSPGFGNINGVLYLCPEKNKSTEQLLLSWTQTLPGPVHFETLSRWPDIRMILDAPHILVLAYEPETPLILTAIEEKIFEHGNLGFILLYDEAEDLPKSLIQRDNVEILPASQQTVLLEVALERMARFLKERTHSILLQKAVEMSSSGIVICDHSLEDTPIVYTNHAFSKMTGYTSEEVLGQNCRFLQGKEQEQVALEEIRLALAEKRSCKVKLKNFRKNGELFWNNLSLSALSNPSRKNGFYLGVLQDITEEMEAKRRLRDSEARFRIMADTLPQLIWLTNREGEWIFANQRAMLFFKMNRLKETSGIYESKLLSADRPSEYAKWIEQKAPFEFTTRLNCEGETFTFRVTGTPRYDVSSTFLGFVVSATDHSLAHATIPHYHDRQRLLASLCMSQMKILRGSDLFSFFSEVSDLFENLQIGKCAILALDSKLSTFLSAGLKSNKEEDLYEQVRSISDTLESTLLIHEGEKGWTRQMDSLAQSLFGAGGNLFHFWKNKDNSWGLFAIRRNPARDSWSRLDLEMISSYGQLICLAVERPGPAEPGGFPIDNLLKQLPYPSALIDQKFKELDCNSEWKTFIKRHSPWKLRDVLYSNKILTEAADPFAGPHMVTCHLNDQCVIRFTIICVEPAKRYLLWAEDITKEHNLESDLAKFRHFESLSRIRSELHNEWANLFGTAKLALESLERSDLSPLNIEHLSQMHSSLSGMESLSRYTEIYTGESSLNLQETDLNQWLSGQREFLRKIWGEEIRLEFLLKHGDYRVKMDDVCMGQVLNSILSHLYPTVSQEGGAFYFFTCKSSDDSSLTLTISTRDSEASGSATLTKYKSLPEHLHMIEDIIDKHGGKIMVGGSSHKAVSSAIITLPISSRTMSQKQHESPKTEDSGVGLSILIIDDNISMAGLIHQYLENKGYRISVAHDCEEGLAMLMRNPDSFQLCICDILLPGQMKGVEMGHHFRKIYPNIRFIFISGYERPFLMKNFGLLESDTLLKKPFSFEELLYRCTEFKSGVKMG